jgi:hypothetical protein
MEGVWKQLFVAAGIGLVTLSTVAYGQQPEISADACVADKNKAPVPGVNRTNLGLVGGFEPILRRMRASGIRNVRLTLDQPFDNSIRTVAVATRLGFRVLFNVGLWWSDFVVPGAQKRLGNPERDYYTIYRLSDLDVRRYETKFAKVVRGIEDAGGRVQAFQIGNEINWVAFNGDLPLRTPGLRYTESTFASAPEAPKIEEGFRKYGAALAATRRVLATSRLHRRAKIIGAGVTDGGGAPLDGTLMSLDLTVKLFRKYRVFDNIDAFAVHAYPFAAAEVPDLQFQQVFSSVERLTRYCGGKGGKPCWISEWGFRVSGDGCTLDDRPRLARMQAYERAIACLRRTRQIEASYLYDWDRSRDYSIWRCGRLLDAGTILRRP